MRKLLVVMVLMATIACESESDKRKFKYRYDVTKMKKYNAEYYSGIRTIVYGDSTMYKVWQDVIVSNDTVIGVQTKNTIFIEGVDLVKIVK